MGTPKLKCPINAQECNGPGCRLWVTYADFQGCVFIASEEVLEGLGRQLKDFLGSPMGKTLLSLASGLLKRNMGTTGPNVDLRTQTGPGHNENLPIPLKKGE
jgi:hypothetical protein